MISQQTLKEMVQWFNDHADSFGNGDSEEKMAVVLKKRHTFRVVGGIGVLGKSQALETDELNLARVMALFHDVGRFTQYARYRTFVDADSDDHARLSLEVLDEHGVLDALDDPDRDLITYCIGWHNKKTVPSDASPRKDAFVRLLRDADKLDIWRVVTGHYAGKQEGPATAIELGLPKNEQISPEVHADIMAGSIVNSMDLNTVTDFMVLQMGWVFDLNYKKSFELLDKRAYLEKIARYLPPSREAEEIYRKVRSYLDEHLPGNHRI